MASSVPERMMEIEGEKKEYSALKIDRPNRSN